MAANAGAGFSVINYYCTLLVLTLLSGSIKAARNYSCCIILNKMPQQKAKSQGGIF